MNQQGFTFIEVLVSMVIFAMLFWGSTPCKFSPFATTTRPFLRTQATYLAYDLADRIRANPTENYAAATAGSSPDCFTAACTPSQLANRDLFEVGEMAGLLLPDGVVNVTASGATINIAVRWTDPIAGLNNVSLDVQP